MQDHLLQIFEKPWIKLYAQTVWRRLFGLNLSQVEPLLFVGGQFRAVQWKSLAKVGIRAVLSLQAEYEDRFEGKPPERFLRLRVPDYHAPTIRELEQAVAFIQEAHIDGLAVFVHCHAGVGRAPTTTAAYLMARDELTAIAAMKVVATARPIITPNSRQWQRLHEWEHYLQS